jgi:hypothetical protein
MTKFKPTPIFIILVIGLVISIPATFYYLLIENRGGMALVGVLAGIYSVVMAVSLIVERLVIRRVKASPKKIWIIEGMLLVVLFSAYSFRSPTYYFKVNDDVQWFGILDNGQTVDRKASYSFPNNKVLTIEKNELLFIAGVEIGKREIDIKETGGRWQGYTVKGITFDISGREVRIVLYFPANHKLSDSELRQVENMLRAKLK